MHEMRPRLGPILPGTRRHVGANIAFPLIWESARFVILVQRFSVILAFPVKAAPSVCSRRLPSTIARLVEAGQAEQVRKEAEFPVAMQTGCILKKYQLSTSASVGFHLERAPFREIPSMVKALVVQDNVQE